MILLRLVFLTGVLAGCATPRVADNLDRLISFENARYCQTSAPFAALLDSALIYEELPEPNSANEIFEVTLGALDIPNEFKKNFGTPSLTTNQSTHTVDVPVNGAWRGVPLSNLVIVQTVESEGGFYLVFDAPRSAVLEAANEAGFSLPTSGLARHDGDVLGVTIQVEDYGAKTALLCLNG